MRTPAEAALVDQLAAAREDAARRAAAVAEAPGGIWLGEAPASSWFAERAAELRDRHLMGNPQLCEHLAATVQPAVVFLSVPDRVYCAPCARTNAPPTDHACDRCGREAVPVRAFLAQQGAMLVFCGVCPDCVTSVA